MSRTRTIAHTARALNVVMVVWNSFNLARTILASEWTWMYYYLGLVVMAATGVLLTSVHLRRIRELESAHL